MEPKKEFNLVRLWPLWFGISAVVIIGGMASVATKGINWGIDFKGGALFEYKLAKPVAPGAESLKVSQTTRSVLKKLGMQKSQIQLSDRDLIIIRTDARDNSEKNDQQQLITKGLGKEFKGAKFLGSEMVGPVIGRELKRKAVLGTLLGCLFILFYVTIRYEFRFAVAGIAALVHDVAVVVGMLSLLQVEINSAFVAALLTVVGYSINDSVVIFDRIRENMKLRRRDPFDEVVNSSLWQTMPRSLNTSLTTEFVLISLLLFGGATIHDFILALVIGITAGAYSSIFIASPMVVLWRNASDRRRRVSVPQRSRESRPKQQRAERAKPTAKAAAPVTAQGKGDTQDATAELAADSPAPSRADTSRAKTKRKAAKRGKRKRRH